MAAPISAGARTLRCAIPKTDVNRRISSEFSSWLFADPLQCVGNGGATYARYVSASSIVTDCTHARAITHSSANRAMARGTHVSRFQYRMFILDLSGGDAEFP